MANTNRYQEFLKETLKPGIQALLSSQELPEDFAISQASLEIFIKAFRSGLPPDLKNNLPSHNLKNRQYLQALLNDIDFFLGEAEASGDDERIGSTVPVLKDIIEAQEKEREIKAEAVVDVEKWKKNMQQQIREYNRTRLQTLVFEQFQKQNELSGVKNQERLQQLSSNVAATIQDYRLLENESPSINVESEIKSIIRQAVNEEAKQIPAEEENEWLEITARPQGADQVAIVAAKEVGPQVLEIKNQAFLKEEEFARETPPPPPPTPSLKTIGVAVQAAVSDSLPNATPQEKIALAKEISVQLSGRLSLPALTKQVTKTGEFRSATLPEYQNALAQEIQKIVITEKVQGVIRKLGASPTLVAQTVSQEISPVAIQYSGSPQATMIGVTMGGGGPAVGHIPTVGLMGQDILPPEGSLLDLYQSSGAPLHFLTGLTSPHGLGDFGKYMVTAGPIRSLFTFAAESIPGMPRLDFLDVGLGFVFQTQQELQERMLKLTPPERITVPSEINAYQNLRELKEVQGRLKIVNGMADMLLKTPGFKTFYKFYYGGDKWYHGLGRWALHPIRTLNMKVFQKNMLAGMGTYGATEIFFAYLKYGGFGGSYVSTEVLKSFGVFGLKVLGAKLGLYEIIGAPGHRHFVFKPAHAIAIRIQKVIFEKLGGEAIKQAVLALIERLGLSALLAGLSGGVSLVFQAALWLFKKTWKVIAGAIGLVAFWLFSNFGTLPALSSLVVGIPVTFMFGPFWGLASGLTTGLITALGQKFGEALWSSFSKGFSFTGNLLSGLSGGFSHALASLPGYAAPVLLTTGSIITGGYLYMNMVTSSAFWLPTQLPQIQSSYFDVKKTAVPPGKLGEPIKYSLLVNVKIDKKDTKLINIKISDKTDFSCAGTPPTVAERTFSDKIPASITLLSPLSIDYEVPTDNSFNDCLITNTATVTADVENGPTAEQSFYTASLTIGNPPVDPPSGWPITNACITQGPNGSYSHNISGHTQALDIGAPKSGGSLLGASILATHKGTVTRVVRFDSIYGNYVIVSGNGKNGFFESLYGHMQTIAVSNGQKITRGDKLGTVGQTGNADGPHLHYEFYNLQMAPPYIPSPVGACVGKDQCNLCW